MNLIVEADAEAAAARAADEISRLLRGALAERGAAHLVLSGGRTPGRCYELLGPLVPDWSAVQIWFADERCVPPDDPQSNALMAREKLVAPGATVHRMRGELGPEDGAAVYDRELADVVLDVVVLGIGEDGHTASLFPHAPGLDQRGARAIGVRDSPKPPPERISLSRETLDSARRLVLLATGADKAAALAGALSDPSPRIPASLLRREALDVIADRAALPDHG